MFLVVNFDLHGRNGSMENKIKRNLWLLLMLLWYVNVNAQIQEIESVSVHIDEQPHNIQQLYETARKLIVIEENKVLDTVLLQQSLDALRMCSFFERADVDISDGNVVFSLVPAKYIRDIRIRREIPLFEDDVINAMSIYPGDVFYDGMLSGQDSLITSLYEKEGFISPEVKVESIKHRKSCDQVVYVSVRAGKYYRMKNLEIIGNKAFSDFKLKSRMKTWSSSMVPGSAGRFVKAVLREDINNLVEFYRSKRFADIEIKDSVITDSSDHSVHVILTIKEGMRYKTSFSKRSERGYRKAALRKDISICKTGNKNNMGIRRSVKAIQKRLEMGGYLDAHVETDEKELVKRKYTEKQVHFSVKSGKRTTVSSINVNGLNGLDKKLVLGQMLHVDRGSRKKRAYNPDKLKEDVFAVQMLYRSHGFLNASISENVEKDSSSADIFIEVDEGKQTRVGEVVIDTAEFDNVNTNSIISVNKGDVFNNSKINQIARELQVIIAEKGYPHAEIIPEIAINNDSTVADVEFKINKGPFISMGEVNFTGAFRTRDKVLHREMKTSPGEPLSLKKIINSQKNLRDLGLFNSVRFRTIGLRERWDTVHVFVEVSEKPPFFGEAAGGYLSDKGPFLNAKVGDRNLFGLNKEAWVGAELSQVGGRGEFGLLEPRLFGYNYSALFNLFGEKKSELNQDWSTTSYGFSVGLTSTKGKHLIYGLTTGYERRRLYFDNGVSKDIDDETFNDERPRNRVVVTPSLSYDRRDSFTRPKKGIYLGTNVDISKSVKAELDNFIKMQIETRGFFSPFTALTFASVVRCGCLYPYGGASNVPADQRFYLGGTRNVRGFKENLLDSSGGTVTLSATVEARITVGYNIEIAVFTDMGRLENDFTSFSPDQFRFSAGTGLRYITPIGPIGILYGWKLDPQPDEDKGAFHFSIGYTF